MIFLGPRILRRRQSAWLTIPATLGCKLLENTRKKAAPPENAKHVQGGSILCTDEFESYNCLDSEYLHEVINSPECYAKRRIHANGLENLRSLPRCSIQGSCVSVELFHLFRYLENQLFRFNRRKKQDRDRCRKKVSRLSEMHISYEALTGVYPASGWKA